MPNRTETAVITADVLTLLWHGQLACAAAIEELALWVKANGSTAVHSNAIAALETIDENADKIATSILALRE